MEGEAAAEVCESAQDESVSTHLAEHSYSKESSPSSEEPMDTASGAEGCPSLTALAENKDTFETLLLCLLQSFTRNQQGSRDNRDETAPTSGETPDYGISSEALNTLSSEQIMLLVTSNSVNYEVIQQIIAQKPRRLAHHAGLAHLRPAAAATTAGVAKDAELKPDPITLSLSSLDTASIAMRVSPDQLQALQEQISELLRSQQITLPANITPEQQQQLIQSLLLQHIQEQQNKTLEDATAIPSPSPPPPSLPPSLPPPPLPPSQSSSVAPPPTEQTAGSTPPLSVSSSQPEEVAPPTSSESPPTPVSSKGDPDLMCHEIVKPKKPLPPYDIFFNEVYSIVMAANSTMGFTEASRIISTMWNALGADVKQRYNDQHDGMQKEYDDAMKQYVASQAQYAVSLIRSIRASHPPPPPHPPTTTTTAVVMRSSGAGSLVAGEKRSSQRAESGIAATQAEHSVQVVRNTTANPKLPVQKPRPKDASMCVTPGCYNTAVLSEERGAQCCSNECAVKHARHIFTKWISQRKANKT